MNMELIESRTRRIREIYLNNNRSVPNAFRMSQILQLKLGRHKFGEYVDVFKRCNDGYT